MNLQRWNKLGGWAGIAFVVLQAVAQNIIQIGGMEPPFGSGPDAIVQFFAARNLTLFAIGEFLSILSAVPFLFFVGRLWAALRTAEGDGGWLSMVAAGGGILATTQIVGISGWGLALMRAESGLDPALAQTLFDMGNMGFANVWVALAAMLLATSAVSIPTGALPRWLASLALVTGVGLVAARAFWLAGGIVFVPYVLYWIWVIAAGVVFARRAEV